MITESTYILKCLPIQKVLGLEFVSKWGVDETS